MADAAPIPARIFKIGTLANGSVSLVFHVPFEHVERALALHALRGKLITMEIRETGGN